MFDININEWIAILLIGPIIGSFAGLLSDRLPAGQSWIFARSCCQQCGRRLGIVELVPVFGWFAVRGKCKGCARPVDFFYPLFEITSAGVALWAALIFEGWLFWVSCGLGWALLTLSAADARHFMLPDKLTLPLIVAGLAFSYAHAPSFLFHHILGAAIGFTIFYAVSYCYRKIRGREGLGLGDAKLMAGAGAWLGWGGLPSVVLWGGFSALIWAIGRGFVSGNKLTGDTALPFGPFLTLGIWLVWLYGPFTLSLPFMSGF